MVWNHPTKQTSVLLTSTLAAEVIDACSSIEGDLAVRARTATPIAELDIFNLCDFLITWACPWSPLAHILAEALSVEFVPTSSYNNQLLTINLSLTQVAIIILDNWLQNNLLIFPRALICRRILWTVSQAYIRLLICIYLSSSTYYSLGPCRWFRCPCRWFRCPTTIIAWQNLLFFLLPQRLY